MMEQIIGQPVNTKSLFALTTAVVTKLINDEITENKANAAFKGINTCVNILNYELKRTAIEINLQKVGGRLIAEKPRLREIESKMFNDIDVYEK